MAPGQGIGDSYVGLLQMGPPCTLGRNQVLWIHATDAQLALAISRIKSMPLH